MRVSEYRGLEANIVFFEEDEIGFLRLESPGNAGCYTWYQPTETGLVGIKLEYMGPLEDAFLAVQPRKDES